MARRVVSRAAKPRSARLFFHRPFLGRWSLPAVRRLRALAKHGPDAVLHRPPPPITRPHRSLFFAPLAAIDPAPDFSAFEAGLELMIFTALFGIAALLVLNWIIKTMRSSK